MEKLAADLFAEIAKIRILDVHSHINPHAPAAKSLSHLLGYHYYTELAHSAGLPRAQIEEATGLEQARRIVGHLRHCQNTVQYSWLIELSKAFFSFPHDELTVDNVAELFTSAQAKTAAADWPKQVAERTNLDAIFLTNDFDDPLQGFDTSFYVPCLRTDDLVFKIAEPSVRERLAKATGVVVDGLSDLSDALDRLFEHFVDKGARACAISLPPDFEPIRPGHEETDAALQHLFAGQSNPDDMRTVAYAIFYALADRCESFELPFDLMIGVWRDVYPAGVHQGRDLFDNRTSLYQFRRFFNEKSRVTFPVSVLTHQQNQELVAYSWIFPNVLPCGHWWYSNIPNYIEADLRARLEAVPMSKQIGYYSDAYKLEFVLPKFNMFKRNLATVLAKDFIIGQGWSEDRALAMAKTILRDNGERIFPAR